MVCIYIAFFYSWWPLKALHSTVCHSPIHTYIHFFIWGAIWVQHLAQATLQHADGEDWGLNCPPSGCSTSQPQCLCNCWALVSVNTDTQNRPQRNNNTRPSARLPVSQPRSPGDWTRCQDQLRWARSKEKRGYIIPVAKLFTDKPAALFIY